MHNLSFDAIGTHWQIDIEDHINNASALRQDILHLIEQYDQVYSRFRSDGLIARMAKSAGDYTLPSNSNELLSVYQTLYTASNGSFTPLIGQAVSDAGYDATYSLTPSPLHKPPSWEETIAFDYPKLSIKQPALLDFGAAGKGHLVDLVAADLASHGNHSYTIDAGGDISHRGTISLEIGLEDPTDSTKAIGIVSLHNQSLAASAGNRRKWGSYHHIIDPKTLASPKNILATWVVANTTMIADGIATCLFFTPPENIRPHFSFSYCILRDDFSIEKSTDFPGEFFTVNAE